MPAGKKLPPAEKYLVARTYQYILNKKNLEPKLLKGDVRDDHVNECLGFTKSTISAVWGHWERHHDPKFAELYINYNVSLIEICNMHYEGFETSCRRTIGESLYPLITDIVSDINQSAKSVSAPVVAKRLNVEKGIDISVRSVRRVLRRMGMRFVKGVERNILAESVANVSFRAKYLRKNLSNLNRRQFQIRPEVFLDETLCNLHHAAQRSWVDEDKKQFTKSGRGPRHSSARKNGIVGEMVANSYKI
ncbi:hypothetical protein PHPALM_30758 [Phytophthora palmivora]|uniref:Transposase n=1 Tax=Phytophthora palmivora TaxID=4796 RepID=A0A2P4X4B8_9STRA|nr:hypothetical protein PHPALM_30758 [Phytophthora palmivora]